MSQATAGHAAKSQKDAVDFRYISYGTEKESPYLPKIRQLISKDLSEPYSIYVYRYFLYQWPDLSFLAVDENDEVIGVIVCKLEPHRGGPMRGYIAMLATREEYRGKGIASKLVRMAVEKMIEKDADEVRCHLLKNLEVLILMSSRSHSKQKWTISRRSASTRTLASCALSVCIVTTSTATPRFDLYCISSRASRISRLTHLSTCLRQRMDLNPQVKPKGLLPQTCLLDRLSRCSLRMSTWKSTTLPEDLHYPRRATERPKHHEKPCEY